MTNISTVNITDAKQEKKTYIVPKQSANTLFHFIEKLDYLLLALENLSIIPRYCIEPVEYLEIGFNNIAYPMICFCDINLHKIDKHMEFYGGYGIAFSKEWGIAKGIQPIQYLNEYSYLKNDFSKAFNVAIKSEDNNESQNFLLSQMHYFKPIAGDIERNEKTVEKNFTDECEWRFVPTVEVDGLPPILTNPEILEKETLNKSLRYATNTWLKFSVDDIKYLILQNRSDIDEVTSLIFRKKLFDTASMHILLSKIIIWDESREDF